MKFLLKYSITFKYLMNICIFSYVRESKHRMQFFSRDLRFSAELERYLFPGLKICKGDRPWHPQLHPHFYFCVRTGVRGERKPPLKEIVEKLLICCVIDCLWGLILYTQTFSPPFP